ncbi:MAG: phage integrase SAM-like domain-containing protein [Mangrovibacterium sp.]
MATLKVILDTRAAKKDGTYPVKLYLSHQRKVRLVGLDISIAKDNWDGAQVVNHKQEARLNRLIKNKLILANGIIALLENQHKLSRIDINELVFRIENQNEEPEPEYYSVFTHLKYFISNCKSKRTAETYSYTMSKIEAFTGNNDLNFEEINLAWLKQFEKYLSTSCGVNTIAIHMRNLRAVFNDAINEDRINQNLYPFRKFEIETKKTIKRSLTIEQLRLIKDYPVQAHQEKYRDLFMLSFYLIGINAIDLLNLRPENLVNGRLEYTRSKVDQTYSIKIEPEALAIIDKYRGKGYFLYPLDQYNDHKNFLHRWNDNLKEIGPVEWVINASGTKRNKKKITPLFPNISTYYARHTWATIAGELEIPRNNINGAGSRNWLENNLDLLQIQSKEN